ncbi:MAG TPA: D-alanyl-D-alanine carboxypeptidase family protein [Gammaproteobacteria bacterium]|nr:D-alanyl-D-alanine carboxypeptidase family protein [Gammaproteobacteria bacterium]
MRFIVVLLCSILSCVVHAAPNSLTFDGILIPPPPTIHAKSYVLMDAITGSIIAEKNAQKPLPPASLTKLMTLYLTADAIKDGKINIDDKVFISTKAWKAPGSRMFLKPNTKVDMKKIIKGVAIVSGNDASIALAEHIAGSEEAFASLMNHTAKKLGMKQSHFKDATGLPKPNHTTTAKDLAILSQQFIFNHPQLYSEWFQDKWFEYNKIKQSNRNRLLWRHGYIDGIKTGHTDEAGHCLISSGKINNTRLIAVVMGTSSPSKRDQSSDTLLTYGFRFFETLTFHYPNTPFTTIKIWGSTQPNIKAGSTTIISATIPKGSANKTQLKITKDPHLMAPIPQATQVGNIAITLNNQTLLSHPLITFNPAPKGSWYTYYYDKTRLKISQWLPL